MGTRRLRLYVRGAVQGVGFRPTVYRVATGLGLAGWVANSAAGVEVEVEGEAERVERFVPELLAARPPRAVIQGMESRWLDPLGATGFEVRESQVEGAATTLLLPDIAACPDCVREILDPADRRYGYPFTNCTNCGPRFTIIEWLPYDRARTTMARFEMCPECKAEYHDPANRRFHAQPNACPACGPQLELWDERGGRLESGHDALRAAADTIRAGRIVAVKGIGGFHLVCDARSDRAVRELRRRKRREEKPLAVMVPDLDAARRLCRVDGAEAALLASPEAPIVLLDRHSDALAPSVAPGNPCLGVMLPYSPLHHLLLRELGFAVVATSGNLSDEPIATDERDALERLAGVANVFLVHNRPIVRYADDSIARCIAGRPMLLRRARGYAPLPLASVAGDAAVLAVGAHLKNAIGFTVGGNLMLSHHLGDLDTPQALAGFRATVERLPALFAFSPRVVAHDLHPDYASTQYAESLAVPRVGVQHHYAHVLACMADNDLDGEVLGVSWDGTGFGPDRTIWGGEFLRVKEIGWRRVAHLRAFPLPGGDRVAREPRRSALGLLYEMLGEAVFERTDLGKRLALRAAELSLLRRMLATGTGVVRTSSAGRLFDAVACLLGVRARASFEGQAAMDLEFAVGGERGGTSYPFAIEGEVVDWAPALRVILDAIEAGAPTACVADRFHETLAEMIAGVARREGVERVCLTGGCFQNRALAERAIARLEAAGFKPYWHQRVPPNDGGIALGQLVAAASAAPRPPRSAKELG
jgi:hydrogenase maturation protein HypF